MTSRDLLNLCETIRAELLPRFPEVRDVRFSINTRYRSVGGRCRLLTGEVFLAAYFYVYQSVNDAAAANTIRHEMAHYVAYKRFHAKGHCHLWRSVARSMGCNGERCHEGKEGDERQMVCQHCNHRTECSERRMRRWDRAGRQMLCRACRKVLPFPWKWQGPIMQMAASMPKRILTQKGLDTPPA